MTTTGDISVFSPSLLKKEIQELEEQLQPCVSKPLKEGLDGVDKTEMLVKAIAELKKNELNPQATILLDRIELLSNKLIQIV